LLDIAERLLNENVKFDICGEGAALDELKLICRQRGLENHVTIHGKLQRIQFLSLYTSAHVVIVPTRSDFCEGMPMVIAEAVLIGRPIITTRLSNAMDVVNGVIVEALPENIDSYIQSIRYLKSNPVYYLSLCRNCLPLRAQFLDGKLGLESVLTNISGFL